jgi:hypothetical protein
MARRGPRAALLRAVTIKEALGPKRQKLCLEYHARSTDAVTERAMSSQRAVHYLEAC